MRLTGEDSDRNLSDKRQFIPEENTETGWLEEVVGLYWGRPDGGRLVSLS